MSERHHIYTDDRLLSVLLNHMYPDHNVREMMPHCRVENCQGTMVLFVPEKIAARYAPKRDRLKS